VEPINAFKAKVYKRLYQGFVIAPEIKGLSSITVAKNQINTHQERALTDSSLAQYWVH